MDGSISQVNILEEKVDTTPPESAETQEEPKSKVICPNCDKKIPRKADFCPKCGQKQSSAKVRMRDLLWKLWVTTFHLDSRGLRTLWGVLSPGKLTIAYFAGKQKKYFHPIQLFFFTLFLLILIVSNISVKRGDTFRIFQFFGDKDPAYVKAQIDMRDSLLHYRDSLPANWQTTVSRKPVDSLINLISAKIATHQSDSFSLHVFSASYAIAYNDMLHMEPDSLLEYYHVKPGFHHFLVNQALRIGLQTKELNKFWVGTLSWSLLVLIAVMGLWLMILYRKQKRYFVEHFVLMLHLQTGLLVVLIISISLRHWLNFPKYISLLSVLWLTVGYFMAFKRYYGLGFGRTLIRWIAFHFLYIISLAIVFVGSIAAAVLLF